jgi:hypothetical protein
LGLVTVVVFSLGFAATLVVVGVIAAQVGQKILGWMSGIWAVRIQIATTLANDRRGARPEATNDRATTLYSVGGLCDISAIRRPIEHRRIKAGSI